MLKKTAAVLLMVSGSAVASDSVIGFNNLSARYIDSDFSGVSGDGYGINLNVALMDFVFATIDYSDRSYDVSGASADIEFVRAGLGANWGFLENKALQVYGKLTWEQIQFDGASGGGSGGGDGGGDGGGGDTGAPSCDFTGSPLDAVFGALGPILGLCEAGVQQGANFNKAATFTADDDRLDGFGVSTGVRYMVMNNVEVGAEYQYRDYDSDDESVMAAHVAYTYGDWEARLQYETYDKLDIDEISLGVAYIFGKTEEGSSSIW